MAGNELSPKDQAFILNQVQRISYGAGEFEDAREGSLKG